MERTESARGRTIVLGVVGLLVAAAGIGLIVAQPSTAGSLAELGVSEEQVQVRHADDRTFRIATTGEALSEGAALRTDRTGLATLNYSDGSVSRIGPSSTFEIETLDTSPENRQIVGRLEVGQTFHRVAKVTGSDSRFEVKTSRAVAAVRGTTFAVQCLVARACEIAVVEGRVVVRTADGRTVEVPAGRRVTVDADGELSRLQLLSNSDAWLELNEDLDSRSSSEPGSGDPDEELSVAGSAEESTPGPTSTTRRRATDGDSGSSGSSGVQTSTTRDSNLEPNPQPDRRDGSDSTTTTTRETTPSTQAEATTTSSSTTTTGRRNTSTTHATTTSTQPQSTTTTRRQGTTSTTDQDSAPTTTRPSTTTTTQATTTTTQATTTTTQATTTTTQATTTTTQPTTTTNPNNASTTSSTSGSQSTTTTLPSCLEAPPPCRAPASNSASSWEYLLRLLSFFGLLGGTAYARSRKEPFTE